MVVELKVLLVDKPLDGCGDGILQVGFCMCIGGSGRGRERMGVWCVCMCMHFICASKMNAHTHIHKQNSHQCIQIASCIG